MMKAAAVKSSKPNESRAAANSIFQKKNDPRGALGFATNNSIPAAGRMASVSNGPAGSSKFIRLYAPSPFSSPISISKTGIIQKTVGSYKEGRRIPKTAVIFKGLTEEQINYIQYLHKQTQHYETDKAIELAKSSTMGTMIEEEVVSNLSPQGRTLSQIFGEEAEKLGITDESLFALLADLTTEELRVIATSKRGAIKQYYANWQWYSACYDTAKRLFDLLGEEATGRNEKADRNNQESIQSNVESLLELISENRDRRIIIKTHYGIHGFNIIMSNNMVEILQSFAGGGGESLVRNIIDNIEKGRNFDVDTFINEMLLALLADEVNVRAQFQDKYFGGGIEDKDNTFPNVDFEFHATVLVSEEEVVKRIKEKLLGNYEAIKGYL